MEPIDEFRNFGKKLPYEEPVGFFDQLSEKTLRQAKLREHSRRKSLVLWRTVAVAASLSALVFLSYFMIESEKPMTDPIVLEQQPTKKPEIINQALKINPEVAEIKRIVDKKAPKKMDVKENNVEEINDVMADLSDEELLQLAAMYEADPFINDSEQ